MRYRNPISVVALIAGLLVAGCAQTQQMVNPLPTSSDYERARSFLPASLSQLVHGEVQNWQWANDVTASYRTQTNEGKRFKLFNLDARASSVLFDHEILAHQLSEQTQRSVSHENLPFNAIRLSEDLRIIRFAAFGKQWSYDRNDNLLVEYTPDIVSPSFSVTSPDGRWAAFRKEHDLWVRDLQSGEDIPLTSDGEQYWAYATDSQGWTFSETPILAWSDDGSTLTTYRLDERGVGIMHILRTAEERPQLTSWPYALPGDTIVPKHHRLVINVETREKIWLDVEPDHQRTSNCCGLTRGSQWGDNQFSSDASQLAFVSTSRDYATVTLRIADTRTGAVRQVYTETDEPFFESNLTSRGVPNWSVLFDSNEFIWFTRKSEWGHLYLHDLQTGELKNQITSGEWNVVDIHHICSTTRRIWFTAVGKEEGRNVYQEYLYVVHMDGSGLQLLTPEEGHHEIAFSESHGLFLNVWSDYVTPRTSVLRNLNGEIVHNFGQADISNLLATGFPLPEPFVVKARDGETDIYGIMFKPSNFDPKRSYPIINSIYPGPQVGSINTPGFSLARRGNPQSLAELGFIVVLVDAKGTPLRSKSFHTAYFGDMADNGLLDQAAAMKQLAERYSWIDINRAGMYGHSGGGFATAAALLTMPEFFKVGVASAGNMDNRGYTFYWGEKYHGERIVDGGHDTFANQALHLKAANLQGRLLITYGTMDTNVHPNTTLLLINELIRHDKDFDVMVFPNRGHGYFNEPYHLRLIWEYFVRHLLENPF
ncbi:MAG: DPP IV N-terminal domain-containing protein [Bacteroidetes bacterium]|nr:DPP IV N-terminal domain-containing protein [Bacteroidota bacterium]MCH8524060.1 S9 family peptidase [Balneolales bacterium]